MSSNRGQLNSNEDSEVMVRQVNLAAAFHDHISCTKMSQHSIGSAICGLPTANISEPPNASIGSMTSELPTAFESDHIYATESKTFADNSVSNGCAVRANSFFTSNLSDERNQISKLTEMILGQLDLIQHQQEQLLKKDRQLQGLKQDREALCLRLEKMEKRIAVLSAKVANNTAQTLANTSANTVNNVNNHSLHGNRTFVNNNSQTVSVGVETDCDQSGSDTIVEETNNGSTGLAERAVLSKLYSNTPAVNSCNSVNSVNKSTTAKPKPLGTASVTPVVKIKTEPQEIKDTEKSSTITSNSTIARKNRKRQPELMPNASSCSSLSAATKKRSKPSLTSDISLTEEKKEILSAKETSCDSLSTLSTTQTNNTNVTKSLSNKKKVAKTKSETSSRVGPNHSNTSSLNLNFKNISLIKDTLITSKPYPIVVNNSESPLELLSETDIAIDSNSDYDEKTKSCNDDVIEVPSWRLHPVSSCYSLEGTEVCSFLPFCAYPSLCSLLSHCCRT